MARDNRKRSHGSAVNEDQITSWPVTRSRTVPSNRHGGPKCEVSGRSLQRCPTSNVNTGQRIGCSPSQSTPVAVHHFQDILDRRNIYGQISAIVSDRCIHFHDKIPLLHKEVCEAAIEAEVRFAVLQDEYESRYQSLCADRPAFEQKNNCEDVQEKLAEGEIPGSKPELYLRKANGRKRKVSHKQETGVQLEAEEATGHEHETSPEARKKREIREAEVQVRFNPICGSYTDSSATPSVLGTAFSNAKAAVTRFQAAFSEGMKSREDGRWDLQNVDVFFARPRHVSFYVKSIMNCLLFKGFENESFNTSSGITRFPDPNLRQANFYEYYQQQKDEDVIEDPQFEEFCKLKCFRRLRKTFQQFCGKSMDISCFDDLDGSNLHLELKEAAKSVWLLHKVAFAFEPPASIFRVEQGVDIDPSYMDTIVNLDDSERFVAKVGFMITPGLRLRDSVYPCEVYLSAKSTSCRQIILE